MTSGGRVDQLVGLVVERERRLPVARPPAEPGGALVREIEVERVLMPEGRGDR
jgi:hypothetical protein